MELHRFRSMGCDIIVGGAGAAERRHVEELFEERDAVFSRFRRGSELNRVNASSGRAVAVSKLFASALESALEAAAETDGLVDPTLGQAIEAAGYACDFAELEPDPRPAETGSVGSWQRIRLTGTLLRVDPGVSLDLNGVVKALAVDDAAAVLEGGGFVSAGGDVATRTGAVVGLPGGGTVQLRRGGVATSGVTRRHWTRGGRPQHHLIDPRDGRPSSSPWSLVTVAASRCVEADVAAKAAFLLGEDGPEWLDQHGLPGRFVRGGEIVRNERWRALGAERGVVRWL
jgi:thiamine biosynthesis lipoprotein